MIQKEKVHYNLKLQFYRKGQHKKKLYIKEAKRKKRVTCQIYGRKQKEKS